MQWSDFMLELKSLETEMSVIESLELVKIRSKMDMCYTVNDLGESVLENQNLWKSYSH